MRNKLITLLTAAFLAASTLLCGCSDVTIPGINGSLFDNAANGGFHIGGMGYSYPNEDRYQIGDAEISEEITALNINWVAGHLKIAYHDQNTVLIREDSSLIDSNRLRYLVENGTLTIQFCKSGVIPSNLNKDLTLTLPKDAKLSACSIDLVSADVDFDTLNADTFSLSAVSGNVTCNSILEAKKIDINETSGRIKIADSLTGSKLHIATVSGEVNVSGILMSEDVEVSTVSGRATLDFTKLSDCDLASTSGDFTFIVPEDSSFKAEVGTVSGNFKCDLPVKMQDNDYIYGDGNNKLEIATVSGNIQIKSK